MAIAEEQVLRRHVDVLFVRDAGGRLVRANEPDGDRAPRLFLARGRTAFEFAVRDDTASDVAERWRTFARALPAWDGSASDQTIFDDLRSAVADEGPISIESRGPAFEFPKRNATQVGVEVTRIDAGNGHLLEMFFPYTREVLADRAPVVGVVVDGAVVSACFSARRGDAACEAGVATEEGFRSRGFGAAVVAAWREAVEEDGRQPLYSTTWDNANSLGIARKLGLVMYAETLSLS